MLRRFLMAGTVLVALALGNAYAQDATSGTSSLDTNSDTIRLRDTDDGFDYGWLGLIGLAGLAGLIPKDRRDRDTRSGTTVVR